MKEIKRAFPAIELNMGGVPVLQPFPTNSVDQIDPFLLLHHGKFDVEKGMNPLHTGVAPHPHRGFMPVTYVISGELHHRDSLGNSSIIKAGGIQWLNAGRGVTHSERPSAQMAINGESTEVIQLWVNLPKKNKMDAPSYTGFGKDELTKIDLAEGTYINLISGSYQGYSGPINAPLSIFLASLHSTQKQSVKIQLPKGLEGGIYIISGQGFVHEYGMIEHQVFYQLFGDKNEVELTLEAGFEALILLGQPIQEPLATYGPFVMNTQTEIMETLRDFNQGKMGVLIEE